MNMAVDATSVLISLVATSAVAFLVSSYSSNNSKYEYAKDLPGPRPTVIQFFKAMKLNLNRKSHEYFMNVIKEDFHPMYFLNSLQPTVLIVDKDAAKQILTDAKFRRDDGFQKLTKGLLDHALFTFGSGPDHKKHRKLIQPGFGPTHLRHAARVSVSCVKKLDGVWEKRFGGKDPFQVDMYSIFATISLDIISQVAFGFDLKFIDKLEHQNETKWEAMEVLTSANIIYRVFLPKFLWPLVGVASESPAILAAKTEIFGLLEKLAEEKRTEVVVLDKDGEEVAADENWSMDVLDRLLLGGEEGNLTQEEIFGELLGFFLAGHETSSNTMTFILLELCLNPDVERRLYEEVKDLNLDDDMEVVLKLPYLDAVMKESQRFHSIVGSVGRKSAEPVEVLGRKFPAGVNFQIYLRGIHLHPKYYVNPDKFDPSRWEKEITPGAFLPFSEGIHHCIGKKLAELEIKTIIAMLVQSFHFNLVPDAKIEFFTTITHGLKEGLQVEVTRRSLTK